MDEDRNRKTGGTGLGLAIAKELADGLGGELKVESIIGVGNYFFDFSSQKNGFSPNLNVRIV